MNKRRPTTLFVLFTVLAVAAAAALALAACGDSSGSAASAEGGDGAGSTEQAGDAALDGTWIADSGTVDGRRVELLADGRITLIVEGSNVGGHSACNSYGGQADFAEGSVRFAELSSTMMGCEEPYMALEQTYLGSLADIDSYALDGDTLTISGAGAAGPTEWVFTRQPPVTDVPLAGSTWQLDTFIDGDAAMNAAAMDAAFVTFEPGGGVTGSTSCRAITGTWTGGDGRPYAVDLAVVDDPAAGVCAADSQALDDMIAPVLGAVVDVSVVGNRLTLTGPDGTALSYTAR